MMKNPFGLPESAAERFVREERERADFYRKMVGGGALAEAVKQATAHNRLLRDMDLDRPARLILETLERDRKQREGFALTASNAWALSIAETARGIAQQSADLLEERRRLSSSVLDTVRAFDMNWGAVATALAIAGSERHFRQTVAGTLAQLSTYGAIAERMRMVDAMTLRASEGVVQSATALAAEMVLETQRIAEAIAAAPTEADSAALVGELFEKVLGYLAGLGPRTLHEISTMGLIGWLGWFFGLAGLVLGIMALQPSQSPQQQAAITELRRQFDAFKEQSHRFSEVEARADEAFVADLPRAELSRAATLRRTPARRSEVVLKAPRGTVLAIEKSEGRWRRVVFRDPLSDQLSRAWVYATAVSTLAEPLDAEGQ